MARMQDRTDISVGPAVYTCPVLMAQAAIKLLLSLLQPADSTVKLKLSAAGSA